MPERRSPLYDYHLRHGGRLIPGGGEFQFPDAYASPADEHVNVRTNVGVQDLSSMGEVDIKGPGAERLINRLLVNEISDLEPGQVRYSTMCNEDGGIVDDLTVYKFSDEHFMIVTSSAPRKRAVRWIVENAAGASAYPTDITASVALLAVQGPRSRDLLREVVDGRRLRRPALLPLPGRHDRRRRDHLLAQRLHRRARLRAVRAGRGGRPALGLPARPRPRVRPAALRRARDAEPAHREGAAAVRPRHHRGADAVQRRARSLDPLRQARVHRPRRPPARAGGGHPRALRRTGDRQRDPGRPRRSGDGHRRHRGLPRPAALGQRGRRAGRGRHARRGHRLRHRERQGPHGRQDARARLRADDARLPGRAPRGARRGPPGAGRPSPRRRSSIPTARACARRSRISRSATCATRRPPPPRLRARRAGAGESTR